MRPSVVQAWLAGCLVASFGLLPAAAQVPADQALAGTGAVPADAAIGDQALPATPPVAEKSQDALHQEILTMARDGYARIQADIQDYTCVLVKRERVNGKLGDYQYMSAKVRHNRGNSPFSVYLKFHGPEDLKGREVLFVTGQNDNKLIARKGGLRFSYITTEIEPTSDLAMEDNRYPITEFGIENLVQRLLGHLDNAILDDCTIEMLKGAKVDGRSCLSIQITNRKLPAATPAPAPALAAGGVPVSAPAASAAAPSTRFHIARVYIDDELQLPIHYEAFDWPRAEGEAPRLLEQYTYRNVKLNVGLSDEDFQRSNPAYGFRKQ